jgi:hypothetical protein
MIPERSQICLNNNPEKQMTLNSKTSVYTLAGLLILIPVVAYFLFPFELRRRFLFEISRQVFLVTPVILLATYLLRYRLIPSLERIKRKLNTRHIFYLYGITVLILLAISAFIFLFFPVEIEDEDEYLFTARLLKSGRLSASIPPCEDFFLSANYIMAAGKWYGIHPPGHPLLLVIPVLMGNARFWAPFIWAGTIVICLLVFRKIFGNPLAFLGALLILFSPMYLVISGSLLSENSSLFIFSLFLFCFVILDRDNSGITVSVLFAGFFCLGMITRPLSFLAVSTPFILYIIMKKHKMVRVLIPLLITLISGVVIILYLNSVITGSWFEIPLSQYQGGDGLGWQRGLTPVQAARNAGLSTLTLIFWYFGNPIIFILPLLFLIKGKKQPYDWLIIFCLLLLILSPFLYWHPGILHTLPRRLYEGLIPITYLLIRGIQHVRDSENDRSREPVYKQNMVAWVVILCTVMNLITFLPGRLVIFRTFAKEARQPINFVRSKLDEKSIVLVSTLDWKFGYPRNRPEFLKQKEHIFLHDLDRKKNRRLLDCFPEYATYQLIFDTGKNSWTLRNIITAHPEYEQSHH